MRVIAEGGVPDGLALLARHVEVQQVAWRHSKMLLGGNIALGCGNARMPKGHGKLFDRGVAFIGQPREASTQVVRPHIGVYGSSMLQNDIVNGLCGKAFPGDFGALCDVPKQSPLYDGADQSPFIHRRLGPRRNCHSPNAAVLADQVGDDPPLLYNPELLYGNCRNLGAPKATADQYRQDGAVPFSPNGVRTWNSKKLPGARRVQPLPDTDAVQANAVHLRDCGGDARIEETVIARFLG
jgi:hypothetical protein